VILGATFATGIRDGGTPSSYLVGVLDGHDSSRSTYMTLSTLNANSVANDRRGLMWEHTGFKRGGPGEPMELGKWFREDDYNLPDFLSPRSLQRDSVMDYDGWTFSKANTYPNVWIDPADSIVLTIKAQELVLSDEHSCGLSMRFPKIKKVRLATVDGDEKKSIRD
jgi:ATP-dependent DNA ligase